MDNNKRASNAFDCITGLLSFKKILSKLPPILSRKEAVTNTRRTIWARKEAFSNTSRPILSRKGAVTNTSRPILSRKGAVINTSCPILSRKGTVTNTRRAILARLRPHVGEQSNTSKKKKLSEKAYDQFFFLMFKLCMVEAVVRAFIL